VTEQACRGPLLRPEAPRALSESLARYPPHYDDVFQEVHLRLASAGFATKLDLAALIGWKHVRNAPWMTSLLVIPQQDIERATHRAFQAGLSDADRIAALAPLPGYGGGGAFSSVLLTAWDSRRFGVFDRLACDRRCAVVAEACTCEWADLPTYWAHLRILSGELAATPAAGSVDWTPRRVEMALMNLPPATA